MCRRLRSVLPSSIDQLKPEFVNVSKVSEKMESSRFMQKVYFDKGAKDMNT